MHYEMRPWIAERHRDADMARLADAAQHAREARRQRSTRRLRPVLRLRRVFNRGLTLDPGGPAAGSASRPYPAVRDLTAPRAARLPIGPSRRRVPRSPGAPTFQPGG